MPTIPAKDLREMVSLHLQISGGCGESALRARTALDDLEKKYGPTPLHAEDLGEWLIDRVVYDLEAV